MHPPTIVRRFRRCRPDFSFCLLSLVDCCLTSKSSHHVYEQRRSAGLRMILHIRSLDLRRVRLIVFCKGRLSKAEDPTHWSNLQPWARQSIALKRCYLGWSSPCTSSCTRYWRAVPLHYLSSNPTLFANLMQSFQYQMRTAVEKTVERDQGCVITMYWITYIPDDFVLHRGCVSV